jgi:hypothetical protein
MFERPCNPSGERPKEKTKANYQTDKEAHREKRPTVVSADMEDNGDADKYEPEGDECNADEYGFRERCAELTLAFITETSAIKKIFLLVWAAHIDSLSREQLRQVPHVICDSGFHRRRNPKRLVERKATESCVPFNAPFRQYPTLDTVNSGV